VSEVTGRVAVVTGGTRGIGLSITAALLSRGVDVVATGRTASGFDAARAALRDLEAHREAEGRAASTGRFEFVEMNVRDYGQVERALSKAADTFGGIDIVINNAGVGTFCEVANQSPEDWRELIETNLTGVFHCCRAAIPHLRRRSGGWIINISSLAGKNPFRGGAGYCASKAGLNVFSEALMQEVRYENIRVSCIMPGSVRTEFAGTHQGAGSEWKLDPDDVARVVADLLEHDPRSLPSHIEIRPSKPER
jgi:NAD(P)-dependent dehydrogenase (short-subunit alcohol dehydrogenase family)